MNKYLEKVAEHTKEALNAFKARQMAKQVGVIPDTDSAWKYALRKLRDGLGSPLEGKSLSEGRRKLGDLTNNSYNQLKSISTKGTPSNTEISARISSMGKVKSHAHGELRSGTAPYLEGASVHTHPYGLEVYSGIAGRVSKNEDQMYRVGKPHRVAAPSGYSTAIESNRAFSDTYGKSHEKAWGDYQKSNGTSPQGTLVQRRAVSGDVSSWSNSVLDKGIPIGTDHRETILAPMVNTVSSTRIKPIGGNWATGGKRTHPITMYFDHTPRKYKS